MTNLPNEHHLDLKHIENLIYDVCGLKLKNLKLNSESLDYAACSFQLNDKNIVYRASKITPKKTGQFVAIWKRNQAGITQPYSISDKHDFIVITCRDGNNLGQFVFPKAVLLEQGIISHEGKAGKRGIRVYPKWDVVNNKQAEKTQKWQLKYFITIETDGLQDLSVFRALIQSSI